MSAFDTLNDAVLAKFGESVTFTTTGWPVTLTGIVDRPGAPNSRRAVESAAFSDTVFGPDDIIVALKSSVVAANGIAVRDTAVIDGHTYTINGLWPDSGGMTALELRA
jgi:hypothetical protein